MVLNIIAWILVLTAIPVVILAVIKATVRRMEYYLYKDINVYDNETGKEGHFKRVKIFHRFIPEWLYRLHDKLVIRKVKEIDINGNPTGRIIKINIVRNEVAESE